jgi:crotonobetainyl-CoA:carnitine CoA-transferase CaiB-like acyl-CoA transferase
MTGALEGLRILDLSWGIAGPLGTLLLAEQGADVIKVEPPGGDPFRSHPGSPVWHRSRRSVELDLRDPLGRDRLLDLVEGADVLIESFAPGTMANLGLGAEQLSERNPQLIVCSIPAYPKGHRAARRWGFDALVQARSGLQFAQPGWRDGPVHLHFPAPSMGASFLAAIGVLAALVDRERTGRGQQLTTSLYQGVLAFTTQIWQSHENADAGTRSIMAKSYPPGIHQGTIYECAAGEWIHAATMSGRQPTATLEEVLGLDLVDPVALFADPAVRAEHDRRLRVAFRTQDRSSLVERLHEAGLGAEPIVPMREAFEHPQLVANGMVARVDDPELGPTTQIGVPYAFSSTPAAVGGPRPRVGEHTDEVLAELREPRRARATGAPVEGPRSGPLAGITVLDIGQFLAGPFGPMVLADLGAEVIKVEPIRGDSMRMATMPFIGCQRNKRGIAVDLKNPEGVEVVLRLAERADVVHHNMTKGTAARLGIDEPALRARNPGLVHCNTYAYGFEGPMSDFGGLDPLYQAICGLEYEAGAVHEGNEPLYIRLGMTDTANALTSVVGVLSALLHRERTGEGQDVWTSLLNAAALLSSDVIIGHDAEAPCRPGLDAGLHGTSPCYRLYRTQDGWVQVAACSEQHWSALCDVLGLGALADDPRARTYHDRVLHRADLEPRLEEAFLQRTALTWVNLFDDAGVPAEVAVDTVDGELVLFDADNERLGLVTESEHPILGRLRQFGSLIAFSAHPQIEYGPPPMVGEHTREVLGDHGFSEAEIDKLFDGGVVAEPTSEYRWAV